MTKGSSRGSPIVPARRLGVDVVLQPGEWLQSAITKWAWQLQVPRRDLLDFFGLADISTSERGAIGTHPRGEVLENISVSTRIAVPDLRLAVMSVFDGGALQMNTEGDAASRRPSRRSPYVRLAGTRYCVECLIERPGVMLSSWRLNWTFLCLKHRAILADTCPSCHQPLSEALHATRDCFDPGLCQRQTPIGGKRRVCGHPLVDHWGVEHLDGSSPLVTAQARVNALTTNHDGLAVFAHLRALIAALRAADNLGRVSELAGLDEHALEGVLEPESHPGAAAPADALAMGALTAAAFRIADEPDEVQTELIRRTTFERIVSYVPAAAQLGPGSGREFLNNYPGAAHFSHSRQLILRAHDEDLGTHQRILWGTAVPREVRGKYEKVRDHEQHSSWAIRAIPDEFWPAWTVRLDIGAHVSGRALARGLREALRYADVWESRRSGEAPSRALEITRALRPPMLGNRRQTRQLLAAIGELRLWLGANPPPIDYRVRRTLPAQLFLPDGHWERIAESVGLNPGGLRRRSCARRYLYHRVSTVRQDSGYWTPGYELKEAEYTSFLFSMTSELQSQLDAYASVLLVNAGRREPVVWEPELFELQLGAPGRDVESIDVNRLHELLQCGERRQGLLARELEVTRYHLMTALDRNPPRSGAAVQKLVWTATDWPAEVRSLKPAGHSLRSLRTK